jgi:hypothetical protein
MVDGTGSSAPGHGGRAVPRELAPLPHGHGGRDAEGRVRELGPRSHGGRWRGISPGSVWWVRGGGGGEEGGERKDGLGLEVRSKG